MKNKRGIVWAPVLIMVGVVLTAGVAAYLLIQAGNSNKAENNNANVTVMNQENSNINAVSNTNQASQKSQLCNQPWNNGTSGLICDKLDAGWHYDATVDRCVYFNGSGCSTSPFTTGEECGRVCGTSKLDSGELNIRAN